MLIIPLVNYNNGACGVAFQVEFPTMLTLFNDLYPLTVSFGSGNNDK
jgi:hypothetical protein